MMMRHGIWLLLITCLAGCRPQLSTTEEAEDWSLGSEPAAERVAKDWLGWRGANGAGIGTGSPPSEFGPTQNVRWQCELPGEGNSSPVVCGDLVLLTAAVGGGTQPELRVVAVNRDDGKVRWQSTVGRAKGQTHAKNGYASPSVATDGRRVFAFFGAAGLFCCDMEGRRQWHVDFPDLDHEWGYGGSPVLFEDKVVVVCDGAAESFIAAFDQASGDERWRTERPSRGSWSTPVFVAVGEETGTGASRRSESENRTRLGSEPVPDSSNGKQRVEMIVNGTTHEPSGDGLVIAYNPSDGRELWRVRGTETFVTPTILVCNGLVYSLSGRNGPIMAIKPGGEGDVTDSRVVWKASRGGPYIPSGVIYRQRLFVLGDAGRLTCYNAGNGAQIWTTRLRGEFTSSLVAADGKLYAISERGAVYVFAAEDEMRQLAKNDLNARCYATPAIVDGQIFLRTQDTLYCFADAGVARPQSVARCTQGETDRNLFPPEGQRETSPALQCWVDSARDVVPSPVGTVESLPSAVPTGLGRQIAWPFDPALKCWASFRPPLRGERAASSLQRVRINEGVAPGNKIEGVNSVGLADQHCASVPVDPPYFTLGRVTPGVVTFLLAAQVVAPAEEKPRDAWPLARGDAAATGVAVGTLPDKLENLWTFSVPRGGFESTVAIVDGMVYAGGSDGKVYKLALADGKKQWEFDTKSIITAAPGVQNGRVYIGDSDGRFYCLDAKTGEKLWMYVTDSEINGGPNFYKDTVLVGSQDANLYCIKLSDGKLVWKFESADQIRSFPTIVGDRTFVAGCDAMLHIVRLSDGQAVGEIELKSPTGATAAVGGERLFVGTEGNEFLGLDWKQDKVVWRFENRPRSAAYRSSAAVTKDLVVVGSRDKFVHAFDPQTGQPRWRFATKGRVDGSPTIVGLRVFVGASDGRLYELDLKTGEERWRFEAGGDITASPAVAEGRLVVGNDRGDLYCFGLRSAKPE